MFKKVNPRQSFPELEEKILKNWQDNEIFEKSIEIRHNSPEFVFYDGPPFATGLPHYGHILAWTIKDVIPRYKTMRWYKVNRKFWWDCHWLPVENLVEKELNLADKKALEKYWIDNFNEACRSSVLRYTDEWEKTVNRMWRWVDFKNSYKTMDKDFMESIWWVFKQLWEKDLVYKWHKPMHICPRCTTPLSNFEVTQWYKDLSDLSAVWKFRINSNKCEHEIDFLAWTTTPWTLPWNVALAVWADIEYSLMKKWKSVVVLAKKVVWNFKKELDWYEEFAVKKWKHFVENEFTYDPIFDYFKNEKNNWGFKIIVADFVSTESWTWIVHIAPAFWEDDMKLWREENLPFIQHIWMDWIFTEKIQKDFWNEPVKVAWKNMEMDKKIVRFLKWKDKIFQEKTLNHSYPTCWRCDTPLLNYATKSWFVKVESIKEKLLKNNQKINWTPNHLKDWRFWKWLEWARDWAISRNRYWWTPMPIWENDKTWDFKCIWSVEELEKLTWWTIKDLHKHFIDKLDFKIEWEEWTYKKIEEVFDCWFESGAMPYAQKHFPFDEKIVLKNNFYWARHWEWTHNVAGIISCSPEKQKNVHLTEKWKKDVENNAKKLWVKFDYIFVSPFERTRETAKIIQENCWWELIEDKRLMEFDMWTFDWQEVPNWHNWKKSSNWRNEAPEWWETFKAIVERMSEVFMEINSKYEWKNILIVSHKWTLSTLQKFLKWQDLKTDFSELAMIPWTIKKLETEFKLPADFIAEWLDQTRWWFYTLHILSTALFDKPAFDNAVVNWIVLAEDWRKMSKSLKNYPDPKIIFDKYWADAMRFYLMSSPVVYWENLRFAEKWVEEVLKSVLLPFWNSYSFFVMYANIDGVEINKNVFCHPEGSEATKDPSKSYWINNFSKNTQNLDSSTSSEWQKNNLTTLDKWILSELEILTKKVTEKMDNYDLSWASRLFPKFFDNITNWYIRRSRKRFWSKAWGEDQNDKQIAYDTLYKVLIETSKILAPFCPFIAEEIYGNLSNIWNKNVESSHRNDSTNNNFNSVHLQNWPEIKNEFIDEKLSEKIATTQNIISLWLWLRKRLKLKVRQPLSKVIIAMPEIEIKDQLETIKEELNVKEIEFLADANEIANVLILPNAKILWPRFWKKMKEIIINAKSWNYTKLENWNIEVCGEELNSEEISIRFEWKDWKEVNAQGEIVVSLDTNLTEELKLEWLARDLIRGIAEMRKEAGYEITDKISVEIENDKICQKFWKLINHETLSSFEKIEKADLENEIEWVRVRIKK